MFYDECVRCVPLRDNMFTKVYHVVDDGKRSVYFCIPNIKELRKCEP